jgi:hypothetical protein
MMEKFTSRPETRRRWLRFLFSLIFLLIALGSSLFNSIFPTQSQCHSYMFPYSPASDHVNYKWTNLAEIYYPPSDLLGPPAHDREQKWDTYVPSVFLDFTH